MITLSSKSIDDLEKIKTKFSAVVQKQMKFARVLALTKTAKLAQQEVIARMPSVFDRPTPFALRSTYVEPATKQQEPPTAAVGIRGVARKQSKAGGYMRAQVYGEDRPLKGSERRLREAGILPPGMWVVPGYGAEIDQYGNMARGQIIAVLSKLQLIREAERSQSGGRRKGQRKTKYGGVKYFVSRGGRLPRGIYEQSGRQLKSIMIFVRQPAYHRRLPLKQIVADVVGKNLKNEYLSALRRAMATAKV
jgi:hypothetical protein